MILNIKSTTNIDDPAGFTAKSILDQLDLGKHVLFFATGGSSIAVGTKIAEILREDQKHNLTQNLTVLLTDERYGPVNHVDSNFSKLLEKGFTLPFAKVIPILTGESRETATDKFDNILEKELKIAEYKIGLFGFGSDGHTAGILPESVATESRNFACGYDTPVFSRITITFNTIKQLDEAVVWAQGEDKWEVLESLKKDLDFIRQPVQILKQVPLLTIFTDYVNNEK